MLGPMRDLVLEEVLTAQRGDPIDVATVGWYQPKWRLEILASQYKAVGAILVGHAQNHERVGVGLLDELLVRPRVDRSAAVKVDMRADDPTQSGGRGIVEPGHARPLCV